MAWHQHGTDIDGRFEANSKECQEEREAPPANVSVDGAVQGIKAAGRVSSPGPHRALGILPMASFVYLDGRGCPRPCLATYRLPSDSGGRGATTAGTSYALQRIAVVAGSSVGDTVSPKHIATRGDHKVCRTHWMPPSHCKRRAVEGCHEHAVHADALSTAARIESTQSMA